jgi:probable F420-dependent oxidoreductase
MIPLLAAQGVSPDAATIPRHLAATPPASTGHDEVMTDSAIAVRADSLQFGINVAWLARGGHPPVPAARDAEAAGYDIVTAADHVGSTSPFVALAAAAAVTTRVRLRTYVLDVGFWNPGLLARDVATLDAISGGRVELGLGVGHMRHEHEAVGLPFPAYGERLAGLGGFLAELRRHLAGDGVAPRPVQQPVPVLMGSMSRRGLQVACREADTVALTGLMNAPGGSGPGSFRVCDPAEFDERVAWIRELRAAQGRAPTPLDMLVQKVVLDRDPAEAAEQDAAEAAREGDRRTTAEDLLATPAFLYARTAKDAAAVLLERSRRWGIGSWCVHAPSMEPMARVIEALRAWGPA